MQNPLYDDITSALALLEARRVWESLRPEAVSSHARQLWPVGLEKRISRTLKQCRFDPLTGCVSWRGGKPRADGKYGQMSVQRIKIQAHRFFYLAFVGQIADGLCVIHKCDNPECVNPFHLLAATQVQNLEDMRRKGRAFQVRGNDVTISRLNPNRVELIRSLFKQDAKKWTRAALARAYGVSWNAVDRVLSGETWRHLET